MSGRDETTEIVIGAATASAAAKLVQNKQSDNRFKRILPPR
jgi:hypothetical protein